MAFAGSGQQKAVQEAGDKACENQNKLHRVDEDEKLKALLAEGVKVTVPWREPFIKASQKVYDEFLKTDRDRELLKIIRDTQ